MHNLRVPASLRNPRDETSETPLSEWRYQGTEQCCPACQHPLTMHIMNIVVSNSPYKLGDPAPCWGHPPGTCGCEEYVEKEAEDNGDGSAPQVP